MKKSPHRLFWAAVVCVLAASCSQTPKESASSQPGAAAPESAKAAPAPTARGESASLHVTATVESVDVANRMITLKDPDGTVGTYEVGEQVKRLAEIKPGDKIHAEYSVGAVAELREPTEEEKAAPMVAMEGAARGPSDAPPTGGMGRAVRAVTTIQSLDSAAQTFTVKGPLEGNVTIHVDDPAVFSHLQVGQTIVVTFAEKMVLSVEPKAKRS
jgi:hypothetical protein